MKRMGIQICFFIKLFIGPIGFYGQKSTGPKLRKLGGSPQIINENLESIFVYIAFLKLYSTVLKAKKQIIDNKLCLE